jgi:D-xylose transport system substrate-binding protein
MRRLTAVHRARALTITATVVLAATGIAACGDDSSTSESGSSSKTAKIALLLPDTAVPRYEEQDKPNFTKRLREICSGCELIYFNANADAAAQRSQVEQAITNGAKALVVNPVDSKAAAGIAQSAQQADVPLVSLGRLIQNGPVTWSVTVNIRQAGVDKATTLVEALKKNGHPKGPIVMINGAPGDTDDAQMKAGAKEVFAKNGVRIAQEFDTPDWSPERAQQEMDQAITKLGKDGFASVYSSNDGMAGGIIAAMKSAGIDPSTRPVTGLDADLAALQRIVAGQQYMTVFQDLRDQDYRAAEIAYALASGRQPAEKMKSATVDNGDGQIPTYQARILPVTKDNLKQEVIDSGFVKPSELCTSQYAGKCEELGISG